jgi:FkbM family methyltransferase
MAVMYKMWHAQHGEDRSLRALLGDRNEGFYIDVGAWDPTDCSVTKHFYDSGWSGINIEPIPEYVQRLRKERPRDITLCCAISDKSERKEFGFLVGSGLSTFHEEYLVNASNHFKVVKYSVECLTLEQVCMIHVSPDLPIDFLKIDVEGWELQVIVGGNWRTYRPKIVVVEAVKPCSNIPAWDEWDGIVQGFEYDFIGFDGLNRWYIDRHLRPAG